MDRLAPQRLSTVLENRSKTKVSVDFFTMPAPLGRIPRYMPRDRDGNLGGEFRKPVKAMGIQEALGAPGSPWQKP